MIVTICGSIAYIDEMYQLKNQLEAMNFEVLVPPNKVPGSDGALIDAKEYYKFKKTETDSGSWIWKNHHERIRQHFQKVQRSDAILVANYDKNGIANYIGPNTLMEMGLAYHLGKSIYLLNPIPEINYKEEIIGVEPIIISGDLNLIKNPHKEVSSL